MKTLSLLLALALATVTLAAQSGGGLVGRWQGPDGIVEVNADRTLTIDGTLFRYAVAGNIITITGSDGAVPLPFELKGDVMRVAVNGQIQTLTRLKAGEAGGAAVGGGASGVRAEMVGKWCYFSNVSGNGGGRMSEECFVLNGNGTFQYSSSTSTSATTGMSSSQGADSGTWTATETSITARSRSGQVNTYPLQKRNNKNNDPMLCLDGRCYATATLKAPWRSTPGLTGVGSREPGGGNRRT